MKSSTSLPFVSTPEFVSKSITAKATKKPSLTEKYSLGSKASYSMEVVKSVPSLEKTTMSYYSVNSRVKITIRILVHAPRADLCSGMPSSKLKLIGVPKESS